MRVCQKPVGTIYFSQSAKHRDASQNINRADFVLIVSPLYVFSYPREGEIVSPAHSLYRFNRIVPRTESSHPDKAFSACAKPYAGGTNNLVFIQ